MLLDTIFDEIAGKIPARVRSFGKNREIRDLALIEEGQREFSDDVLYFGYDKQIQSMENPPRKCVVAETGAPFAELPNCCDAVCIPVESFFFAFNTAKSLLDSSKDHGLYGELTAIADRTKDIDAVINTASIKLGNSLILSDMNFKIISSSTSIPVMDPLWKSNIEQGYCSYEFMTAVMQLEPVRKAAYTTEVIEVTCSESPYRKLSSKVFLNGVQIAFMLMIESETPVTPAHFESLQSVSHALSYTIANYTSYLFQGVDRYQQLLYDLLIGASPEDIAPMFSGLTFSPSLIAMSIKPAQYVGRKHLKEKIGEPLKAAFPNLRITYHDDCIAALVQLGSDIGLPPEVLNSLEGFGEKHLVRIGVSNAFSRVENFEKHYRQASAALSLGQRITGQGCVFLYRDYQFLDLLSHVDGSVQLGLFCHPVLGLLSRYDHENGTELYRTLRGYVDSGGSVKDTAAAMYIHRNSLMYRLNRIAELGKININDPYTKFILKMSFQIDTYAGLGA